MTPMLQKSVLVLADTDTDTDTDSLLAYVELDAAPQSPDRPVLGAAFDP